MSHATVPNLVQSLTPFAQPESQYTSYIPFRTLTARLIGSAPNFYPIISLSSSCINTHVGLFSPSFHSPSVDLRMCPISPSLRRTAFLVSSLTFDCAYCVAHAAAFGDMLQGSKESQICYNGKHPKDTVDPDAEHLTPAESAVIRLSVASAKRGFLPAETELKPLCMSVKELLGASGLEIIKGVISFAGCLNTLMDTLGVQLEEGAQQFAVEHFRKVAIDFKTGKHHNENVSEHQPTNTGGLLSNVYGVIDLTRAMISAMIYERTLYQGIPNNDDELNKWMKDQIGERLSQFFINIRGIGLKRAICFGIRENLMAPSESRCWSLKERCGLLYLYASKVGCQQMVDLAVHITENTEPCEQTVMQAFVEGKESAVWSEAMMNARRKVIEHLDMAASDSGSCTTSIMETCSPEQVVELAGFLSWLCYWRRNVLLFASDKLC